MITKCFLHYQEFFKKNSGAENLLLRVNERYSDLSGAEDLVEAENCDNNVHQR